MSSFETSISRKLPLVSLISAIFIIYTNIAWIPWELSFLSKSEYFGFFAFFTYRFLFFLTFIYLLLRYNLGKLQTSLFTKRLWKNFLFSFIAYLFYATISFGISFCTRKTDCMGSILIFQFFVTCLHTFLLCKNLNCPTPLHVGMIYFDNHVIIISKTFPYL